MHLITCEMSVLRDLMISSTWAKKHWSNLGMTHISLQKTLGMGDLQKKKFPCKKLRVKTGGGCLLEGDIFALRRYIFRSFIHPTDMPLLTPGYYQLSTKLYKLNKLKTGVWQVSVHELWLCGISQSNCDNYSSWRHSLHQANGKKMKDICYQLELGK